MSHGSECRPQVAHVHTETTFQLIHVRLWRLGGLRRYTPTVRRDSFFPLIKFNYAIGAAFSDGLA
jgi:hypothetical protein